MQHHTVEANNNSYKTCMKVILETGCEEMFFIHQLLCIHCLKIKCCWNDRNMSISHIPLSVNNRSLPIEEKILSFLTKSFFAYFLWMYCVPVTKAQGSSPAKQAARIRPPAVLSHWQGVKEAPASGFTVVTKAGRRGARARQKSKLVC